VLLTVVGAQFHPHALEIGFRFSGNFVQLLEALKNTTDDLESHTNTAAGRVLLVLLALGNYFPRTLQALSVCVCASAAVGAAVEGAAAAAAVAAAGAAAVGAAAGAAAAASAGADAFLVTHF
jgi:type IV secretory pathway TrbL component